MRLITAVLLVISSSMALAATIVKPEDQLCRTLAGGDCRQTHKCESDETRPQIHITGNRKWCMGHGLRCCVKKTRCDTEMSGNCRDSCWHDEVQDKTAGLCNSAQKKCCVFEEACEKRKDRGFPGGHCRPENECLNGEVTPSHLDYVLPSGVKDWCSGSKQRCCVPERIIRLSGDSDHRGRVEVYRNGEWGTVCDHKFAPIGWPSVACVELGFGKAIAAVLAKDTEIAVGSGPIFLKDPACRPHTAIGMAKCLGHDKRQECLHDHDVVITCEPGEAETK